VTLLYSAHDVLHNGAVVLHEYLMERQSGRSRRAKKSGRDFASRTTSRKKAPTKRPTASSARRRARK
jgi:hypothetical protein